MKRILTLIAVVAISISESGVRGADHETATDLKQRYEAADRQSTSIAIELQSVQGLYQPDPDRIQSLEQRLRSQVRQTFELKTQWQRLQLDATQRNLDLARERMAVRGRHADQIVARRIDELQRMARAIDSAAETHLRPMPLRKPAHAGESKSEFDQRTIIDAGAEADSKETEIHNGKTIDASATLGISTRATLAQEAGPKYRAGLLITSLKSTGPAARAGLREGDVIVGIGAWQIESMDNLAFAVSESVKANKPKMRFVVVRGGETVYADVTHEHPAIAVWRRLFGWQLEVVDRQSKLSEPVDAWGTNGLKVTAIDEAFPRYKHIYPGVVIINIDMMCIDDEYNFDASNLRHLDWNLSTARDLASVLEGLAACVAPTFRISVANRGHAVTVEVATPPVKNISAEAVANMRTYHAQIVSKVDEVMPELAQLKQSGLRGDNGRLATIAEGERESARIEIERTTFEAQLSQLESLRPDKNVRPSGGPLVKLRRQVIAVVGSDPANPDGDLDPAIESVNAKLRLLDDRRNRITALVEVAQAEERQAGIDQPRIFVLTQQMQQLTSLHNKIADRLTDVPRFDDTDAGAPMKAKRPSSANRTDANSGAAADRAFEPPAAGDE